MATPPKKVIASMRPLEFHSLYDRKALHLHIYYRYFNVLYILYCDFVPILGYRRRVFWEDAIMFGYRLSMET